MFRLEGVQGDLDAIFKDDDSDGLRRFWISDIGPGDAYRRPAVTYTQRTRASLYQVRWFQNSKFVASASRGWVLWCIGRMPMPLRPEF